MKRRIDWVNERVAVRPRCLTMGKVVKKIIIVTPSIE